MRARDGDDRVDTVAVLNGPLERLHTAKRPSGDAGEPRDAELVEECPLGPHHVGDRDDGEIGPVGSVGGRVQ